MIKIKMFKKVILGIAGTVCSLNVFAAPSIEYPRAQSFLFIENNIDSNYFITTTLLDPRFSGSNAWSKYASSTDQSRLGYMGHWLPRLVSTANKADIWLENFPAARPFEGMGCRYPNESNCPSAGYFTPEHIDDLGIYRVGPPTGASRYDFGLISHSGFTFFREMAVGQGVEFVFNSCITSREYNPSAGERCATVDENNWRRYGLTYNKIGHMRLIALNSFEEIFIDSNGYPTLGIDNTACVKATVGRAEGVTCQVLSYNIESTLATSTAIRLYLKLDRGIMGFTPTTTDVQFSYDGATWTNNTLYITYTNLQKSNAIYVFMSNDFFKKLFTGGLTTSADGMNGMLTFMMENTVVPESGYYEFTPSSQIVLRPRTYGVSITSRSPKGVGKIGDDAPVELEYRLSTTGPRQADEIIAQVTGDASTSHSVIQGKSYCLFSSEDGRFKVPFSAYLEYEHKNGRKIKSRRSCDDVPVDLIDARWSSHAWESVSDKGFEYITYLKLIFPMNEGISQLTTDSEDWLGQVHGSGKIQVTTQWHNTELDK